MNKIETEIQSISSKGHGIGSFERENGTQASVEIPLTLPGEVVSAHLMGKRKKVFQGHLENILKPSPLRIEHRCKHYGECGGCRFQHLDYQAQLEMKEKGIRELFDGYEVRPIVPSPEIWGYRNKMEFSFSSDKAGVKYLGLNKMGRAQRVVDLEECHLVNPWFMEALKITKEWWKKTNYAAYHPHKNEGFLRNLTVREGRYLGDRMVMLTVSQEIDTDELVNALKEMVDSIYLRIQKTEKGVATQFSEKLLFGHGYIREVLDKSLFHVSPTAFFQPNPKQADNLVSLAMQIAQIDEDEVVYDLYCGTGTLGICAAKRAKKVIGMELCEEAVMDAKKNAELNKLTNYEVTAGDVGKMLTDETADTVFLNPPRSGLMGIENVLKLNPKKIVYISCNPKTQVRDVLQFVENGYRIEVIQPVDQFPHTLHVENIVLCTR